MDYNQGLKKKKRFGRDRNHISDYQFFSALQPLYLGYDQNHDSKEHLAN